MKPQSRFHLLALAAAATLAACGGGGSDNAGTPPFTPASQGTLHVSLTDAPACGYDHAWVTVEKVRVHRSATAGDADGGWHDIVLPAPTRVDLLTLNNGAMFELGEVRLPAGAYTQMRLVLADNSGADPLANAVQPSGSSEVIALKTPSGQQSGLKMNVDLEVPEGKTLDVAIDFDACKSFVTAGKSGKILLKPVLAVIPILSDVGQKVVGFVDPSLIGPGTAVMLQSAGVPVRGTTPDANGRFILSPVDPGTYDLVITAPGRANAVMTGVPVVVDNETVIGSSAARFDPPPSAGSFDAFGTVKVGASFEGTDGLVRALQTYTDGTTIEAGFSAADPVTGAYSMTLPTAAPATVSYAPNLTAIVFGSDLLRAGLYTIEASVPGETPKTEDITLDADVETNFVFP